MNLLQLLTQKACVHGGALCYVQGLLADLSEVMDAVPNLAHDLLLQLLDISPHVFGDVCCHRKILPHCLKASCRTLPCTIRFLGLWRISLTFLFFLTKAPPASSDGTPPVLGLSLQILFGELHTLADTARNVANVIRHQLCLFDDGLAPKPPKSLPSEMRCAAAGRACRALLKKGLAFILRLEA